MPTWKRCCAMPRFSAQRTGGWVMRQTTRRARELKGFQRLFARAMLFLDAPDHQRIRRVLNAGFRPADAAAAHAAHRALVDELLDARRCRTRLRLHASRSRGPCRRGHRDADGHRGRRSRCVHRLVRRSGALSSARRSRRSTRHGSAQASLLAMSALLRGAAAQRRRAPRDDLVSRLVQAEAEGQIRRGAELLAQCAMLLFAGHETTRNLLGNGLQALAGAPRAVAAAASRAGTAARCRARTAALRQPGAIHRAARDDRHRAARPGRCAAATSWSR